MCIRLGRTLNKHSVLVHGSNDCYSGSRNLFEHVFGSFTLIHYTAIYGKELWR
jgi:hypothetical protein